MSKKNASRGEESVGEEGTQGFRYFKEPLRSKGREGDTSGGGRMNSKEQLEGAEKITMKREGR